MCSEKVPHEATSRRNAICVLFLFFKVAKIIQKPNQYVREVGKKGYLFSVVCDYVFFVCDDSMSTCFLFINSVLFCCKLSGLV